MQMVAEKQASWDDFLDPVLFLFRTSTNPTTKFTPYSLMYSRKVNLPNEVSCLLRMTGCDKVFRLLFFSELFAFMQNTLTLLNYEDQEQDACKDKASTCMDIINEQQNTVKQLVRLYILSMCVKVLFEKKKFAKWHNIMQEGANRWEAFHCQRRQ